MLAFDGEKHLIHMPLVARAGTAATELIGILLAELAAPLADRLISHDDSAFKKQLFDITKTQAESEVQPHGVADDLHRKAVVLIVVRRGWRVHTRITSYQTDAFQSPQQIDYAHHNLHT